MSEGRDDSAEEPRGCLDEQEAVDFAAGIYPPGQLARLEEHLSHCDRCPALIAAAAPHVAAALPRETRSLETQPLSTRPTTPGSGPGRERPLLAVGTALDATYQVVGFLGRGGMGDVYEVKHARLAGRYAAKLLSSDLADNSQAFSRFQREAMIASGLSHPNIVNVIDFCHVADGRPCLVMEYLDGVDLARIMAPGPVPLQRTLKLVRQIVSALGTLHGHQIIHRDLKPQNIFVLPGNDGEPERVKLVDFGLAKYSNPTLVVTHDRTLLGTPQYMAPEQAVGNSDSLGPEADQFSLAAIVYEMLGGRHPFAGVELSTVLYRIVHEVPAPLGALTPHVPPHVVAAIERGLAKDRQDRFLSVKAFLQALEGGGPVPTVGSPSPVSPEPATPAVTTKRRRAWFVRREVLASVGVLAATVGLIGVVRSRKPAHSDPDVWHAGVEHGAPPAPRAAAEPAGQTATVLGAVPEGAVAPTGDGDRRPAPPPVPGHAPRPRAASARGPSREKAIATATERPRVIATPPAASSSASGSASGSPSAPAASHPPVEPADLDRRAPPILIEKL